uniref:Uncharacterized protein n=1 Tax=Oryza barthii TaxID=65489 RepID=A0A0D3GQJ2_9ORYZ
MRASAGRTEEKKKREENLRSRRRRRSASAAAASFRWPTGLPRTHATTEQKRTRSDIGSAHLQRCMQFAVAEMSQL